MCFGILCCAWFAALTAEDEQSEREAHRDWDQFRGTSVAERFAWLRQILGRNWLYMERGRAKTLGLRDGDWVHVTSHHGRIKVQLKLMDGVNPDTVWTWNAIGKRSGAWNLDRNAPEARKGFLLNHIISDLLPAREGGYRYSNSDPVTGQAAWYDLRVRVEKATGAHVSEPQFETLKKPSSLFRAAMKVGQRLARGVSR